jgi:hypothetical protein
MEKTHEGGFEKDRNCNLDRCVCCAAVVRLV